MTLHRSPAEAFPFSSYPVFELLYCKEFGCFAFFWKTLARSILDLSAQGCLREQRKDVDPQQVNQIGFFTR